MMSEEEEKERITRAFRELRKRGYFARQNFWCCMTCGCAEVPKSHADRYVFYHGQDAESLANGNGALLAWAGDGDEIVRVCQEAGLSTKWDGSVRTRIWVGAKSP